MTCRWKSITGVAIRFVLGVFLYICILQAAYFFATFPFYEELTGFNPYETSIYYGSTLLSLLLYYSMNRTLALYDTELYYIYCTRPPANQSYLQLVFFLLRNGWFWIQLAAILVCFWCLPVTWSCKPLLAAIPALPDNKLLLSLYLFPLLLLETLAGQISAVRVWLASKSLSADPSAPHISKRMFVKHMGLLIGSYLAGGVACSMVLPIVLSMLPILFDPAVTTLVLILVSLLAGITLLRFLRAVLQRKKAFRRLQNICTERNIPCTEIRHPYRSIRKPHPGEDFRITCSNITYSCKFISGLRRGIPIFINEDGTCAYRHALHLRGIEFLARETSYHFGWKSEHRKILLIHPTPTRIFGRTGEKHWQLDNGDWVGAYRIYTPTAFLNALERDCLDK